MGQAAVPIMIASTVASGAMQYRAGKSAAIAAENEGKRAAEQEQAQIREEQIERRERLIRALSAQNAAVGASGARLGGSALNAMETDIKEFGKEDFRANLAGKSRTDSLRAQGKSAAKAHRMGANLSLVDTAARTAQIGATDWKK